MMYRKVEKTWSSRPTIEGAGVRLRRAIGPDVAERLDPFLLLDDFASSDPKDYLAGFPWHPHRGIETVTYIIDGRIEHGDSMGNRGEIGPGEVQWMTAGAGIIHQEMPKRWEGMMQGFQLWVNLPSRRKMMDPRYRSITAEEIPEARPAEGVTAKVISGSMDGVKGPVRDLVVNAQYADVSMDGGAEFEHDMAPGHTALAYVHSGSGTFADIAAGSHTLVLLSRQGRLEVSAGGGGIRFLLISGKPLGEPIAWGGPIVMNTQQELEQAFEEYANGTFIRP